MSRMVGFIGNHPELGPRALEVHRELLKVAREGEEPLGWGLGFYQHGEVLLRRRPVDDRPLIDLVGSAEDVRTEVLIGHVRRATVGPLRTENTHPFRYRGWLYADTGTIRGFDGLRERLLASLPEFLRQNVRGDTDSEASFYLFLSFLHDAGQLQEAPAPESAVKDALRSTCVHLDRLTAELGARHEAGSVLLSNGERLYAVHRRGGLALRHYAGASDARELLASEGSREGAAARRQLEGARLSLVVTGAAAAPASFQQLGPAQLAVLSPDAEPRLEAL